VSEHPPRTTALQSYELDEVEVPIGEAKQTVRAIRITIHGQNIFLRAPEPIVRIGDTEILYPRIEPDEQTITGYITDQRSRWSIRGWCPSLYPSDSRCPSCSQPAD